MLPANPSRLWREVEVSLLKQNWSRYFKGKILDLGCGGGEIAKELFFNKGQSFVKLEWGLDNDRLMVKKAIKSRVYKEVILGDVRKINLKNGVADLVFSNSVIEHIQNIDQVLKEINRVLKPGGRLIATMPSDRLGEYLGWGKGYALWFNYKYHHYNLLSKAVWKKLLKQNGLDLIEGYYYLDKLTIKKWHKLLWWNKLGIKLKTAPVKPEKLKIGAALAILAKKI